MRSAGQARVDANSAQVLLSELPLSLSWEIVPTCPAKNISHYFTFS